MLRGGMDFALKALLICAKAEYRRRQERARDIALHDCLSALWKQLERAQGLSGDALAHEIRVSSCMTAPARDLAELVAPFRRRMSSRSVRPRTILSEILEELPGEHAVYGIKYDIKKERV